MRIAIIGAGPMGISAALLAAGRGHDVTVLERDGVGASLLRWGAVRFFTPLAMNLPHEAAILAGISLPPGDAILTGAEMVETVLRPLARSPSLAGRILTGHTVVAVGRAGLLRGEHAGHPLRAERPFRLLVRSQDSERTIESDAVLDASGVYDTPAWTGGGGLPATGEMSLGDRVIRHLGMIAERPASLSGRSVMLVGNGHSAANALLMLEEMAAADPATRVTWAVRCAHQRPCEEVAADPLPERRRVTARANDLAQKPPGWLTIARRAAVEAFEPEGERLRARLSGGRSGSFDTVVSMTGYRPDHSILSELALDIAPSSEGAGGLSRALSGVTDCLRVPHVAPEDLASGEPGFHLVGAKSYGRSRTFLLKTGLDHLTTILEGLGR